MKTCETCRWLQAIKQSNYLCNTEPVKYRCRWGKEKEYTPYWVWGGYELTYLGVDNCGAWKEKE